MAGKYRILLTRKSLNSLTGTTKSDRSRVKSFLHFLIDGRWEESPSEFGPVHAWKQTGERRFVFSCSVFEAIFAIWEALWTIDLAVCLKKSENGEKEAPHEFSPHILLYVFGEFPGDPDTMMHLMNRDFELKGSIESSYLDIHEREMKDEVKYNEELYILAPPRVDDVLRGEQRGLPLHLTVEQVDILSTHRVVRGPILVSGEAGSGKTCVITPVNNNDPSGLATFKWLKKKVLWWTITIGFKVKFSTYETAAIAMGLAVGVVIAGSVPGGWPLAVVLAISSIIIGACSYFGLGFVIYCYYFGLCPLFWCEA